MKQQGAHGTAGGLGRAASSLWEKPIARYLVVGGALFLVDLAVFLCLRVLAGLPIPAAQAASRATGAAVGFAGHKIVTFRNRERGASRLALQGAGYAACTIANIAISPLVVTLFAWLLPWPIVLVKVVSEVVMVVLTYIMLRWIFKARRAAGSNGA